MIDTYPELDTLWAELPEHGAVTTYGQSVQGRPLVAVEVGGDGPAMVVTAGLHGLEYIGVQVALEVLRRGPIPGCRLTVLPVLNPDGYARTWEQAGVGRVRDLRKNARGVDLNRNFPLPYGAETPSWVPGAGSTSPDAATYRGPHALSEPESAALATWLEQHDAHASANLHSFMGTLIAARVWHPDDWRGYTALGRAFRSAQPGLGYQRLATPLFDVFTGELEDWQHHCLGCWSVCVESFSWRESLAQHLRAPSGFWRFNPREPDAIARRDAAAVRALLQAAATMERPPLRAGARLAVRAGPAAAGESGDVGVTRTAVGDATGGPEQAGHLASVHDRRA